MTTGRAIRFLRHGRIVDYWAPTPMRTVLDYLRLEEKSRGTKEGCNEGDCGACTVAIGSLRRGRLVYEPANACILLMGHLHGKELVTVDDLGDDRTLHPVQKAMVDTHGSQCGFCTPGFVMSLFTLYHQKKRPTRAEINDHIAGNLCRCTGYAPIIAAASKSCVGKPLDRWVRDAPGAVDKLGAIARDGDVFLGDPELFVAVPRKPETLLRLAEENPDATVVAGATDVGLWITKQLRDIRKVIHIGAVEELHEVSSGGGRLRLGAAATYAEAEEALSAMDPDLGAVLRRIGSKQVRSTGTVGGNIANGSPIGDMPPMLIALGATVTLRHAARERVLPLEDFFIAYGKQDRLPGELVWHIDVPMLKPNECFRAYKVSKRFDQDISAVLAAFRFSLDGHLLRDARIAFGGMAATPKCASHAEAAAMTISLDHPESWNAAIDALADDFAPISDMRATAAYRLTVAKALFRKALTEVAAKQHLRTRLTGQRGKAA